MSNIGGFIITLFFFQAVKSQNTLQFNANGSVTVNSVTYTQPLPNYYSVDEYDFTSELGNGNAFLQRGNGGLFFYSDGGPGIPTNAGIIAAINLPHNAIITKIMLSYDDRSPNTNLKLVLRQNNLQYLPPSFGNYAGAYTEITSISSNGSIGQGISSYTLPTPFQINNNGNSYHVLAYNIDNSGIRSNWAGFLTVLRGFIIEYSVSATN